MEERSMMMTWKTSFNGLVMWAVQNLWSQVQTWWSLGVLLTLRVDTVCPSPLPVFAPALLL